MTRNRSLILSLLCFAALIETGCQSGRRLDLDQQTGGSAFLYRQFQAYDGRTGRPLSFAEVAHRCERADVVLFGEEHNNTVCNQIETQLLYALLQSRRPWALAMEFFEADTQESLNAYRRGRLDEPAFLKATKRGQSYLTSHRSLIELCRATRTPVIAANAPRRLVKAYRKSGQIYEEYRASLPSEDQRWLPLTNMELEGPYRDRFAKMMSFHGGAMQPAKPSEGMPKMPPESQPTSEPASQPESTAMPPAMPGMTMPPTPPTETQPATEVESQPSSQPVSQPSEEEMETPAAPAMPTWQELFKAQLLWDQAMSESIAESREDDPERSVMLIVGGFHVAQGGGTLLKYKRQRHQDRVVTVVYRSHPTVDLAFDEEDHGAGDIVIYGLTPAEEEKPMGMPMPTPGPERPSEPAAGEQMPGSVPAEAMPPASMPSSGPTNEPAKEISEPASIPASMPTGEIDPQQAVG